MALEVLSLATNKARSALADMFKTGKSFKISSFSVGASGHDLDDPTIALSPDPTLEDCSGVTFGPKQIPPENITTISVFCPSFRCTLTEEEANGPISSLCLFADVVYDPSLSDPLSSEERFIFSIANFPLKIKTDNDVFEFQVIIQF